MIEIFKVWSSVILLCISNSAMSEKNVMYVAPSLFLNHGGGPFPVLGEPNNVNIANSLRAVKDLVELEQLTAIILVTAHWESDVVLISFNTHHNLYFDYYNFPPESYKYEYNAPGDPKLALEIHEALEKEGIESKLDNDRGWDHGLFIPMMLAIPKADIPIVQVSILANQDAKQHYRLGEVLYNFRKKGIAVFGSGMSYHNMAEFKKTPQNYDGVIVNQDFDNYINEVCTGDVDKRRDGFVNWKSQSGALEAHPLNEADHFMPLIVNAGAGGSKPAQNIFSDAFIGKFKLSGFIWREE